MRNYTLRTEVLVPSSTRGERNREKDKKKLNKFEGGTSINLIKYRKQKAPKQEEQMSKRIRAKDLLC